MTSGQDSQKDTIYIDVDDEITAVIDKLRGSPRKIVALVLPKRAAVFQSVVNMKLLKRTAENSHKKVVLITSEAALLPLAAASGVHVAKNLQTKPEIPAMPSKQTPETDSEPPLDKKETVGSLADKDKQAETSETESQDDKKSEPSKKKSKAKVPNFEKFRTRIILGVVALIVLIGGFVFGWIVLPGAEITVRTETSDIDTEVPFTAATDAQAIDEENKVLPAISKEFRRTDTEQVDASGEKNKGKRASGSIVLTNCSESTGSLTIPKGTGISTGDLTYITQQSVTLPESQFNFSGDCTTPSDNVNVAAENPGAQYNISSGKDFSVAGYPGVEATNNSAMTGGTDNIVKVVTQADIDKGRQAIQDRANDTAAEDLQEDIRDEGYYPIASSLVAGEPTITTDKKAGDEANSVTVTSTTVNTMLGVKEEDLNKLISAAVSEDIDTNKQSISDNGLGKAKFTISDAQADRTSITLETTVTVGPDIDTGEIKQQVAGKSRGETEKILNSWPDVSDVDISYSPFWVRSTPGNTGKITIIFENSKQE